MSDGINTISWFEFQWESAELDGIRYDRVAMTVPLAAGEFLQLDTGADISFLYPPCCDFDGVRPFELTGKNGAAIKCGFACHKDMQVTDGVVGTLGANYFADSVLLLDYPNQRFAKVSSSDSGGLSGRVSWLDSMFCERTQDLCVAVSVAGEKLGYAAIDTGSSLFDLTLNRSLWLENVHSDDRDNPPVTMAVPAWGGVIEVVGAPVSTDVQLADKSVSCSVYSAKQPDGSEYVPADYVGVLGNGLFSADCLVLDYINGRVGLLSDVPPES